HGRAR
ncbi:hypothetical protein BN1723_019442, partial [Verticillium longisporum]